MTTRMPAGVVGGVDVSSSSAASTVTAAAVSLQEGEDRVRLCTRRHRWNARDGGRSAGGESAAQH
jgi:hypothetical protein